MNPLEIIAVALGLANVGLLVRRSIWNYPVAIALVLVFAVWHNWLPASGAGPGSLGAAAKVVIAGARAVVARAERSSWITRLLERRHYNVVVVALANKMARTAWAALAKGAAFDQVRWNPLAPVSAS